MTKIENPVSNPATSNINETYTRQNNLLSLLMAGRRELTWADYVEGLGRKLQPGSFVDYYGEIYDLSGDWLPVSDTPGLRYFTFHPTHGVGYVSIRTGFSWDSSAKGYYHSAGYMLLDIVSGTDDDPAVLPRGNSDVFMVDVLKLGEFSQLSARLSYSELTGSFAFRDSNGISHLSRYVVLARVLSY